MEFRRTETFYCHHGVQGSDSGHMLEKINQLFSVPPKKRKSPPPVIVANQTVIHPLVWHTCVLLIYSVY